MDGFSSLSFTHTRREGNNLAHKLARHARRVSGYLVWMEDVPPQLQNVLQADFGLICFNKSSCCCFSKKKKLSNPLKMTPFLTRPKPEFDPTLCHVKM